MKVYIGPFINWYGPYQLFGWVRKLGVSDAAFSDFFDRNEWIEKVCTWIHNKRNRTIYVKIDDYDVWGADHTLALIILPVLKKLREKKHGSPITDFEDAPAEFTGSPDPENGGVDDKCHERWAWILDEMIWAFQSEVNETDEFDLFYNTKTKTWDHEGMIAWANRQANGFRLFGKYYRALWD